MNLLPYKQASEIPAESAGLTHWLVEGLWSDQAVGILGGEPKCCKSFLALDLAVSVAAGVACLRRYPVRHPGRVLLFPAEDALGIVRQRLQGICAAAGVGFESLPLEVITVPVLRLDTEADRQRLAKTVEALRPRLLILDPMIRLHRLDENDASQIAVLLSHLRELQRRFQTAVVLVHHARKDSNGSRPGQALRGSSELHGWGDSNLYMRRRGQRLTLTTEHRAAPSIDDIPLQLTQSGAVVSLAVAAASADETPPQNSALERVRQTLQQIGEPASVSRIRKLCGMRMASVCESLAQLVQQGIVAQDIRGYRLDPPKAA
ncbi:MAG: AAA family ATPase [Tepidisphaeraceae bacterium]